MECKIITISWALLRHVGWNHLRPKRRIMSWGTSPFTYLVSEIKLTKCIVTDLTFLWAVYAHYFSIIPSLSLLKVFIKQDNQYRSNHIYLFDALPAKILGGTDSFFLYYITSTYNLWCKHHHYTARTADILCIFGRRLVWYIHLWRRRWEGKWRSFLRAVLYCGCGTIKGNKWNRARFI